MTNIRTGEFLIQDNFQREVETGLGGGATSQKVVLWNAKNHGYLKQDAKLNKKYSMVIMGDMEYTKDRSFGVERNNIFANIQGLVSSIHKVNKEKFDSWLHKNPSVKKTSLELAQMAASHLAQLFEEENYDDKTSLWRLMLALGEKSIWEREDTAPLFNRKNDPRFLSAESLGAPHAEDLYYIPLFTSKNNKHAFLDMVPSWVSQKTKELNVDCLGLAQQYLNNSHNKNTHFWVREYPMGDTTTEYPDFVLFINGLPILWVEIKTPQAGIKEAIKDFQTKPQYQGAPLCLASNGKQAILSSRMTGNLETWVAYSGNISDNNSYWNGDNFNPLHGQAYLIEQILSKPSRFEFLITRCGAVDPKGFYMTARAQQYQALARFEQDLEWTEVCSTVLQQHGKIALSLGNRLVRQTQRTGKTHTMVRAIHLALSGHPTLYRLSLLMVGEVLILGQIHEALEHLNIGLADKSLQIQRVESRQQLNELLKLESSRENHSEGKVVLANMQKISAKDTQSIPLTDSEKTLVVLDEGHLSQTGMTAGVRETIFPNASHLLLTATPKSEMATHYGIHEKHHVLDDFGYGLAKASQMVCPVVYKRYPYRFKNDPNDLAKLAEALELKVGGKVSLSDVQQGLADITQDLGDDDNAEKSSLGRGIGRQLRRMLEEESIPERLDAIVYELDTYRDSLETLPSGEKIFEPRALVFDRDTQSAIKIIEYIQSLNGKDATPSQKNMYKGFRFGIDVSNFGKEVGKDRSFQSLNPSVGNEADIKNLLESTDKDNKLDVLLAVGKYTKGYNNDQLALVVLLRNVAEPSLMNQIYTRPATMREGKPKGMCLDLAFGQGNVVCWQESLRLYDKEFDLSNLLEQKDIDELVKKVRTELENTSKTVNATLLDLATPSKMIATFEALRKDGKENQIRRFFLQARNTIALIAKMPDSSLYKDLKHPLVGLRIVLSQSQALYPDLVADTSVGEGGLVEGGQTNTSLGEMIREALAVLNQSSLKSLLDVSMDAGFTIEAQDQSTKDAVHQAKLRQATVATVSALEAVVGKEDAKTAKKRDLRASTVLFEALNRALDRLRDDIYPNKEEALLEAQQNIASWMSQAEHPDQSMEHFLLDSLEDLVGLRADSLGLSDEQAGIENGGMLSCVLKVASSDMAQNFGKWYVGLSSDWAEKDPERLAQAWRNQYSKTTLMDFVAETSTRESLHGTKPAQWLQTLMQKYPVVQTRGLLGEMNDERLAQQPSLIDRSMLIALEKRQAVLDALAWGKSLNHGALK